MADIRLTNQNTDWCFVVIGLGRKTSHIARDHSKLKASRLRLNPTKTQVMWLGSQQMLARLDIDEMPVLSSTIPVQQSARDLAW